MTALETHIEFQNKLQEVSSYVYDSWLPEERDMILNEAMYQVFNQWVQKISNRKREGTDDSQRRADDLASLKKVITLSPYHTDDEAQFAFLPSDYFFLLWDRSVVSYDCKSFQPLPRTDNRSVAVIEFIDDTSGENYENYKLTVNLNIGTLTLFEFKVLGGFSSGLNDASEKHILRNIILDHVCRNGLYEIYWEKYDGKYYNNSFVIVTDAVNSISVDVTTNSGQTDTVLFDIVDYQRWNNDAVRSREKFENRLVDEEDLFDILGNNFSTTRFDSPVSVRRDGKLYVYRNDKFFLDTLEIGYYRKPRLINLQLNQGFEFGDTSATQYDIQRRIVDRAVQLGAARISSGNYQGIAIENQQNE